jgi:hypothetical protein
VRVVRRQPVGGSSAGRTVHREALQRAVPPRVIDEDVLRGLSRREQGGVIQPGVRHGNWILTPCPATLARRSQVLWSTALKDMGVKPRAVPYPTLARSEWCRVRQGRRLREMRARFHRARSRKSVSTEPLIVASTNRTPSPVMNCPSVAHRIALITTESSATCFGS